MFKSFLIVFLCSFEVFASNWLQSSNGSSRQGQFDYGGDYLELDLAGFADRSNDDPEKIVGSSGYSINGHYQYGLSDLSFLTLFEGDISTGLLIRDGIAYFGTTAQKAVALDLKKKALKWEVNLKHKIKAEPIDFGADIFFCDLGGQVTSVSNESGGVNWQIKMKASVLANPVVASPYLVLADQSGLIQVIHAETSEKHWSYQLPSGVVGTPLVHEDKLWVATLRGALNIFDLNSGVREIQKKLSGSVREGMCLSFMNEGTGTVSLGTEQGMLHSFDLEGNELPLSPMDLELSLLTPIGHRGLVYVCNELSLFQINPWIGESLFEFTPSGQNFFNDLVFDGKILHSLVLVNKKNASAQIFDYQFRFNDHSEITSMPLIDIEKRQVVVDGLVEEGEWDGASILPLNWMANGSPHFHNIELRLLRSEKGLFIYGEYKQGGRSKFSWDKDQKPYFKLELVHGYDIKSLKINPFDKELGPSPSEPVVAGVKKNNEHWFFESRFSVSNDESKEKYKLFIKVCYVQPLSVSRDHKVDLVFGVRPSLEGIYLAPMKNSLKSRDASQE